MPTLYPDVVRNLLSLTDRYRRHELNLDEMKTQIWEAARSISSPDEADLRRFLQSIEGRFDVARFTVDAVGLDSKIGHLIDTLEERLRTTLSS